MCVTVPESRRGCSGWEKNGGRTGQGWSSSNLGNVKFEDSHRAHDDGVFVKMKYSVYTQVGMISNFYGFRQMLCGLTALCSYSKYTNIIDRV